MESWEINVLNLNSHKTGVKLFREDNTQIMAILKSDNERGQNKNFKKFYFKKQKTIFKEYPLKS